MGRDSHVLSLHPFTPDSPFVPCSPLAVHFRVPSAPAEALSAVPWMGRSCVEQLPAFPKFFLFLILSFPSFKHESKETSAIFCPCFFFFPRFFPFLHFSFFFSSQTDCAPAQPGLTPIFTQPALKNHQPSVHRTNVHKHKANRQSAFPRCPSCEGVPGI